MATGMNSATCQHEPCGARASIVANLSNWSTTAPSPWAGVFKLADASNASWHELVAPLALMTKLTYTATAGTYYNASERDATVPGWVRPAGFTANPPAGMRALLFVQEASRRGVVAFRGTDLGPSGASSECDRCADALLWDDLAPARLPPYCRRFSNATLDYWATAQRFVERVVARFPHLELLFTGHSLGAGLAFALAAVTPPPAAPPASPTPASPTPVTRAVSASPAVAFAAPSWTRVVKRRAPHRPLPSPAAARLRFYALADEWDPVQRASSAAGGLLGTQCLWASPEPPACAACYAPPLPPNATSPACERCFALRHVFAHYIYVDVPGPRARCSAG